MKINSWLDDSIDIEKKLLSIISEADFNLLTQNLIAFIYRDPKPALDLLQRILPEMKYLAYYVGASDAAEKYCLEIKYKTSIVFVHTGEYNCFTKEYRPPSYHQFQIYDLLSDLTARSAPPYNIEHYESFFKFVQQVSSAEKKDENK